MNMKLMFASDIHGSAYAMEQLCTAFAREQPRRLFLLGDLLYHGPRNDLPRDYAPKRVIERLNGMKEQLLAVRGNCEAEVDQMVLQFPVMADYAVLYLEDRMVFLTHGHVFNEEHLPALGAGDVFMQGHTHVHETADRGAYLFLNPGSVALPKGDGIASYLLYEDGVFFLKTLEGKTLKALSLRV